MPNHNRTRSKPKPGHLAGQPDASPWWRIIQVKKMVDQTGLCMTLHKIEQIISISGMLSNCIYFHISSSSTFIQKCFREEVNQCQSLSCVSVILRRSLMKRTFRILICVTLALQQQPSEQTYELFSFMTNGYTLLYTSFVEL